MGFTFDDYIESDEVKKKKALADANSTYSPSNAVLQAKLNLDSHSAYQVPEWDGGTYGQAVDDAISKITNRDAFSYSLNGDALYQQYKNQYINQGRLAMQDAMGQAAALTGGYGNSYAATVGNQQYQAYLQKLNDVVPELYQLALNKYNQEGQDLMNQYSILNNQYNAEYGQYRDKVSDWNATYDRLANAYYNEANMDYNRFADNRDYYATMYNNERNYDYGLYSDAYNRAYSNYQQSVAEDQWQKSFDESNRQWQASFDENVRQYNQTYALQKKNAASASANAALRQQIADMQDYYSGWLSPEMQKAQESANTKAFQTAIMTPAEFAKRGNKASGKAYDNYNQYVSDVMEAWYKNNNSKAQTSSKLTENEVAYLKSYYGIS